MSWDGFFTVLSRINNVLIFLALCALGIMMAVAALYLIAPPQMDLMDPKASTTAAVVVHETRRAI